MSASSLPEADLYPLQIQYRDLRQQQETAVLGMWLFLASEVMFFGGAIACFIVYAYLYPDIWHEFSQNLLVPLGTINTAILLTSSLLVALAVQSSGQGKALRVALLLTGTSLLGALFLAIKSYEWYREFQEGFYPGRWALAGEVGDKGNLYFRLYFALTGLHALHVLIGVVVLAWVAVSAARGRYSAQYFSPVEVSALYWHFVDVVWIFLFPMLYLIGRAGS